jgi:voltage-gated potassium channel
METRKKRIFDIIQIGYTGDFASKLFDVVVTVAILSNLVIAILETFDELAPFQNIMDIVETVTVVGFTVEYVLRVWTAEYLYPHSSQGRAKLKYVFSFNGIIDLLSFFPYYLPVVFPAGAVAFRMFRIVRILRLFRVNAYSDALSVIGDVLTRKKDQILSSVFIVFVLMIASSLCMYSLEHEAQPEVFKNAFSGFWWSVSTLLTVGYGDIYPITFAGRIFGIAITFLGVGMVAIPTGILSAGFVEQYTLLKQSMDYLMEEEIKFVRLEITEDHPWIDKRVSELPIPPGLILAVIQRRGEALVPHGDTVICQDDYVVLGAEGGAEDLEISLKELQLRERHPWVGHKISDLDISRHTLIIMIRRDGKVLIPNGSVELLKDDTIFIYSKKNIADAQTVKI